VGVEEGIGKAKVYDLLASIAAKTVSGKWVVQRIM